MQWRGVYSTGFASGASSLLLYPDVERPRLLPFTVVLSERPRNLHDDFRSRKFRVSKIGAGGGEVPRVGGDEEEARACICRNAFAEDKGVFVVRGPIDELIRRGGAQSVRAEVGISHRDTGRRRQPDSDGVRAGTERGGAGEDAIVEIKQACDVGTNHAKLNLNRD